MVFFTVRALVGLDTLGTVASNGPQGFLWLVVLAAVFVLPYALVMAEVGAAAFTQEGGPYEWTKLAFSRFQGAIAAVNFLPGHEPTLGRWFAGVHRHGRTERQLLAHLLGLVLGLHVQAVVHLVLDPRRDHLAPAWEAT